MIHQGCIMGIMGSEASFGSIGRSRRVPSVPSVPSGKTFLVPSPGLLRQIRDVSSGRHTVASMNTGVGRRRKFCDGGSGVGCAGLRRAAPGCAGLRRAFPPGEGRAGRHTERREGRARVGSMETQPRMMNDECNATYETAAGSQAADVRRTAGAGAWQSGRCARPASGPGLRRAAAARARAAPPAAS